MEQQENPTTEVKQGFFQSTTAKMIMVGFLTLVLLIPLFFVQDLISERSMRQKEVTEEVSTLWEKKLIFMVQYFAFHTKRIRKQRYTILKQKRLASRKTAR